MQDEIVKFQIEDDKKFRILQLTDIHYGAGFLSHKSDKLAEKAVRLIIEEAKPDLIICTGDLVYPIPIFSGSINNKKEFKKIGGVIDSYNIPWTICYGNHDVEPFALYNKSRISDFLITFKNSVFRRGPKDIDGQGNQIIKLYHKNTLALGLVLLDSNMYCQKGFFSGFDHIHDNQIDWYEQEILKLKEERENVPTLMFFHIPCTEYKTAWREYTSSNKDNNVEYLFGEIGEINEYFGTPKFKSKIFDRVLALGSTKGIFCGHDHLNTSAFRYKGVTLTYGMSIDFLAYKNILKYSSQRGGTIIDIDKNGEFDISQIKLMELKGGYCNQNKYL